MKRTEKVALLAMVSYAALAGYLFTVAAYTRATGLVAGGVLTLVRFVTAILVLMGLRFSERHSKNFPMGMYKLENLLTTLIGAAIVFIAYEFVRISIREFGPGAHTPHRAGLAFGSLILSAAVAGFFAWYKAKVAREENSPSLRADARNSRADFIALVAVILGIVLEMVGVPYMTSVVLVGVGAYLGFIGLLVVLDGLKVLLDASVERGVLEKTKRIALDHPLVRSVLDVKGRNSGSYRFINLSVVLVTTDLREAKNISRDIEARIHGEIPNVDKVMVEFEVEQKDRLLCAVPTEEGGEALARSFIDAPAFEVLELEVSSGELLSRERLANPVEPGAAGRGVRTAVFLARRGLELLLTRDPVEDDDLRGTLEAYGVEILPRPDLSSLSEAGEALSAYASGLSGSPGGGPTAEGTP